MHQKLLTSSIRRPMLNKSVSVSLCSTLCSLISLFTTLLAAYLFCISLPETAASSVLSWLSPTHNSVEVFYSCFIFCFLQKLTGDALEMWWNMMVISWQQHRKHWLASADADGIAVHATMSPNVYKVSACRNFLSNFTKVLPLNVLALVSCTKYSCRNTRIWKLWGNDSPHA